jgi:FixJ family two-component response regulator
MTGANATVFLVDDDPCVLRATSRLFRSVGLNVSEFMCADEFLNGLDPNAHGCVLLDIGMPGLSGLDLQGTLRDRGCDLPIIFLTGCADVPMSVRAMKQGAVDLITKPADGEDLIRAVRAAVQRERENSRDRSQVEEIRRRLATLTPREREVLEQVIAGKLNKQTAAELGTAEKTIKVHRGRIMQKTGVTSVAELVRLADRGGVTCPMELT